jgi:hypothetical protein
MLVTQDPSRTFRLALVHNAQASANARRQLQALSLELTGLSAESTERSKSFVPFVIILSG